MEIPHEHISIENKILRDGQNTSENAIDYPLEKNTICLLGELENNDITYNNQIAVENLSEEQSVEFGESCSQFEPDDPVSNNVHKSLTFKDTRTARSLWTCPYCPYKAVNLDLMYQHIADTHASVTCYKCLKCQYAHPQLSLVIEHVSRKHENLKHQCPECKVKFTTVWNCEGHILTRHSKNATKLLETLFSKRQLDRVHRKCPYCKFSYDSPTVLKKHVEKNHFEVIIFKCLYCTYKNLDLNEIENHMKENHEDERDNFESDADN